MQRVFLRLLVFLAASNGLFAQDRVLDTKPTSANEQLELREFTRTGDRWYGLYLIPPNSPAKEVWASIIQPHQVVGTHIT